MRITADQIILFVELMAALIKEHRDELTQLDAPIGDADHGVNLDRGFSAALARLPALVDEDIGTILKSVGLTLLSNVGGAAGPLYGTAFIRAGTQLAGRTELTPADLLVGFEAALEGVVARGKAQPGEKTMIDTIAPAVDTMRARLGEGAELLPALRDAVAAAHKGMLATIPMEALKGRARFLGPRSIGHQDPGATSAYYLFLALLQAIERPG